MELEISSSIGGKPFPQKSGYTSKTDVLGKSEFTLESDIPNLFSEDNKESGEELKEEICLRGRTSVITDPTPKQILSMFKWKSENLYDHMRRLLEQLISTRPENVMEYFDQYSRELRNKKPREDPMVFLANSVKLAKMYGLIYPTTQENQDGLLPKIADPWEYVYYFEEIGVSLPREELYQISLALRKLSLVEGLSKIRFWGKLFGLDRSYIVAECELTHDEIEKRIATEVDELYGEEEVEEEEDESIFSRVDEPFKTSTILNKSTDDYVEQEETERFIYKKLNSYKKPPLPKPNKQVRKTMPEPLGEGANKKVYYVCHEAGDEWILLPNVKPEHIAAARQIRKYMKGYLLSKVESYPPFKGSEKEFLRAQIARITSATQISPLGYYQFGGGEEAVPEEGIEGEIIANLDYEPIPPQDLLKTGFWVHHSPYILRIGRTSHWLPEKLGETEMEEETFVEEMEQKEIGPPLLTPISEDVMQEMIQPWSIKSSSMLLPASGVVLVRSNLWPGAYAFAKDRTFDNIYIGWGLKLSVEGFSPSYLPQRQNEYELGPEIMEVDDPSPQMEEAWRDTHRPPPLPMPVPEEEGGLEEYEDEFNEEEN